MLTMLKRGHLSELSISRFPSPKRGWSLVCLWDFRFSDRACAALSFTYVVNLEIGNLLKWVIFNIVSGQATGDALWK